MNYKKIIRIVSLTLALLAALSFASCSRNRVGEMTDQSSVSKSGMDNTVKDNEHATLTRGYYNWVYSSAFSDFSSAVKVMKLPADLESGISSLTEERKISHIRNIFLSMEFVAAIQTASELENGKSSYTHNVISASRISKGNYTLKMKFKVGSETYDKNYKLMLSEETRRAKLIENDNNGNEISFHEIIVTNDGYIAVNRCTKTGETWGVMQLMFKGGETPEGYCEIVSDFKETPKSIYEESVYAGFAGKK